MSEKQQPPSLSTGLDVLLEVARDLTASLAAADRYERLLAAVRRLVPCDAACLMRLDGDELVPVAGHGLAPEALVHRYARKDHPRLDIILASPDPVRFPVDSDLPDPFDGQLASDPHALEHIHACLGCSLREGDEVVGALTADALAPHAFDGLEDRWISALGALAGAALRTTGLIEAIERHAERSGAVARELMRDASSGKLVGSSPAMQKLLKDISVVAASDLPVLIAGETGTGKELVAQQLHSQSSRRNEPLIQVNCAALPESIAESELFGHVRGAFTGAVQDRAGKFELANGATLFLDEIGELPQALQPKLLRALQQGEIQRVGEDRVHRVDVRIIAATNRDLEREVEGGRFRADLYHRLAVYPLKVPPLRDRRDDIPLLASYFLDEARRRLGLGAVRLSPDARGLLRAARWPGNVRELENVLNRAVLRMSAGVSDRSPLVMRPEHLDVDPGETQSLAETRIETPHPRNSLALPELTREFQRTRIEEALRQNNGNWAAAARTLGLHRSNLHRLAQRLGLKE